MKNRKKIDWWLSGGSVFPKKDYILLHLIGQSNLGTNPNTGRVPPASMPTRLKPASYDNVVHYDIALAGTGAFAAYQPGLSGREMGWQDQVVYVLSQCYTKVFVDHRGIGGTVLGSEGVAYNRSDAKNRGVASRALVVTEVGEGNFNEIVIEDHGESDSSTETASLAVGSVWAAWIAEYNTAVHEGLPWFIRLTGNQMIPDFPYVLNTQVGQTAAAAATNNFNFDSDYRRTITFEDDSHFGPSGAISVGNSCLDEILRTHGITRPGTTPVLSSAAVDSTGFILTLTYDQSLDTHTVPFWAQWNVEVTAGSRVARRTITAITILDNTIQLTLGVPIRVGDTARCSYTKDLYYRENICDPNGNEVADLSNVSITNNSSAPARTYTAVYTYNFAASTDGFATVSGSSTIEFGQTVGGQNNCLKVTAVTTTPACRDGTTPITLTNTFLISFDAYKFASPRFGYNTNRALTVATITPTQLWLTYEPMMTFGEWFHFEIEKTATGADDLRFDAACNIGDQYAFQSGMQIHSVT